MTFAGYRKYLWDTLVKIDESQVENLFNILIEVYKNDKTVFVIGNGGSAANASHFAQDLAKGTRLDIDQKKRIKALSLTDNLPFFSALANDDGYDSVFEQQLMTFAQSSDLLFAISGSGNSKNVIQAVEWANDNGLETVGVTGFDGGRLRQINKYSLHVPLNDMCSVESIHSIIFHYIVLELQEYVRKSGVRR